MLSKEGLLEHVDSLIKFGVIKGKRGEEFKRVIADVFGKKSPKEKIEELFVDDVRVCRNSFS